MLTGYFTGGFLMCLLGEPYSYSNCMVYRSNFAYPTEQECQDALIEQSVNMRLRFDPDVYEIANAKCIEWLPSGETI